MEGDGEMEKGSGRMNDGETRLEKGGGGGKVWEWREGRCKAEGRETYFKGNIDIIEQPEETPFITTLKKCMWDKFKQLSSGY